jgi:hypothetical protein
MHEKNPAAPFGFLTAQELPSVGFCGGLLLLNDRGRPEEFHCNSPIRPTRTQEILYGATLRPFLLTECIAIHLIAKCSRPPAAILTDLPEIWELAGRIAPLLAWIPRLPTLDEGIAQPPGVEPWYPMEIAGQTVGLPISNIDGRAQFESSLGLFAQRLPLHEPFQRILQAMEEAHSISRLRASA